MEQHHHPQHSHTHYALPIFLVFIFAVFEAWGGWWTHSLALLSDAGHMFTDVLSLGLAWLAAFLATCTQVKRHRSGLSYPELWAGFINIMLMLFVIISIVAEAFIRLQNPPNVAGGAVIWIALIGLIVNLLVAKMLHLHAHAEDINKQAALSACIRRFNGLCGSYYRRCGDLLHGLAKNRSHLVVAKCAFAHGDDIVSCIPFIHTLCGA